jgi:hypothetical protein
VTTPIDNDDELNWVAPSTLGKYVIRYEVESDQGTFADDVDITVIDLPTGPQTVDLDSIPSRAAVGEPTFTVPPPTGATPTVLGDNTVLGQTFYLGYAPPPGGPQKTYPDVGLYPGHTTFPGSGLPASEGPQTVDLGSIPSRALVGEPTFIVDPVPEPIILDLDSIPSNLRMGAPSFTIGAAPPDQPITDLTISLYAVTPDGNVALPDFESLELSPLRNSGGSITLDYPPTGVNFAVLREAITGGRDIEVEIWTSGTSAGALRGYLDQAEGDDTAEAGAWKFAGRFLGGRMDEAVVLPQDPGPLVPDNDDNPDNDKHVNEKRELVYSNATAGTVMLTALRIVQEHGWLTDIVWDFTGTHDSDGVAWPQVLTTKFSPGASMKQLLDRLVALQLAEWDVQWNGAHRVLRMWVPEGRGDDLSLLVPPVVLRHGQNVLDAPRRWSVRESGTDVLVAGDEGLYAEASDPAAVTRRGRRIARFVSANNLIEQNAVTAYAINQLPVITTPLHEVAHGIGFLPGTPRPLVTYNVGDWVLSETAGEYERLRVVQWTLSVDKDHQLSGTVTLNDTITDQVTRLKAQLEAITAGETVVGTSTPPSGSLSDITPPAAPEGLTVSSIAYQDPAHTNTLASVTVGWLPVRFNADGSNYPQVQAARYIIIRLENVDPERPDTAISEDWTWPECPQVVVDYNDLLLAAWAAAGKPGAAPVDYAAQAAWLQSYVDEFSATPTATDDVAGYQVRYAYIGLSQVGGLPSSDPFPDDERFYYEATPTGGTTATSYTFGGVEGGANVRIEVRAFDRSGNFGPWASIGHDTASDDTPPPRPGPPGLSVWFRTLDITWNGLGLIGEPMPVDFDHVEVWVSSSADFSSASSTASQATAFDPLNPNPQHVANLYAAGTHNQPDIAHGVGYYAALRAVDRSGNVSEMSQQAGPATAEQLFPDDLRDQIINDPNMIARETIGTLHVVDGAIINAKIANLAVNDAKIQDLNVGKLRSGTMIAQVTISGKFRTHESDAANRVEFDAAGLRLYRGATVVGNWDVATGDMLITGTWRTGVTGERVEGHPDGTLRWYPQSGSNYSQMSNVGSDVVWRGPVAADGRSGRVNVNALGVGLNYSAESEIPDRLRAEILVTDRRTRITAPFTAFEVDGRYTNPAGGVHRVQFSQLSSSGTTMPYSYLSYGVSSSSGRGGMFGNGSGFKFEAGNMLVTDDSLNSFGPIKTSDLVETSSRKAKRDIAPARSVLDPKRVIKAARARSYRYKSDPVDAPPRFGVIAEELPVELQRMTPDGKGGLELSVSLGSQIGLLWAAVEQLIDEREVT